MSMKKRTILKIDLINYFYLVLSYKIFFKIYLLFYSQNFIEPRSEWMQKTLECFRQCWCVLVANWYLDSHWDMRTNVCITIKNHAKWTLLYCYWTITSLFVAWVLFIWVEKRLLYSASVMWRFPTLFANTEKSLAVIWATRLKGLLEEVVTIYFSV